jgi:hypothetical protein
MIDVPIHASVACVDGPAGRATRVIVDKKTRQVTHLVVTEPGRDGADHLVRAGQIAETTPNGVRLHCTRAELAEMEPFTRVNFMRVTRPYHESHPYDGRNFAVPELTQWVTVKNCHVPKDGALVRRGAPVRATNGRVGRVEQLLADPTDGHITHLVMRERRLWQDRHVPIPLSAVSSMAEGEVWLNLDRHAVASLSKRSMARNR